MAAKGLDDLVEELKDEKSEEDETYYTVPEEKPDERVGKMEKVDENGKKWDGSVLQTDSARMLKGDKRTNADRNETYKRRDDRDKEFKRRFVSAKRAAEELKYEAYDVSDKSNVDERVARMVGYIASVEPSKDGPDPFHGRRIFEVDYETLLGMIDSKKLQNIRQGKKGDPKNIVKEAINIGSNVLSSLNPFKGVYSNFKTKRHLKKNGAKGKKVVFLHPGMFQTRAAMAKAGDQLRENGYLSYVLPGGHFKHKDINTHAKENARYIKDFFTETGTKPADYDDIALMGHSSGAHVARALSNMEEVKELGIKRVYQLAPSTSGNQKLNRVQKLLGKLARREDPKYLQTKKNLRIYLEKPLVDNYVISGYHDALSTQKDAVDPHAKLHYLLEDGAATHFGTAGTNRKVNQDLIDLTKYHLKETVEDKLKGGVAPGYRKVRDK